MNCESGSVFSLAMPWQKEQTQGGRNVGVGVAAAVVKRLPDTRGTTNLMIYVAHATSPAIPNLMLYDRRVALHIRILRHIHTDVYMHVRRTPRAPRIIPRWPNWNLSLSSDKKGTANLELGNPSARELCRKIVVEFQLLPENTTEAAGTNFGKFPAMPLVPPSIKLEYFSCK